LIRADFTPSGALEPTIFFCLRLPSAPLIFASRLARIAFHALRLRSARAGLALALDTALELKQASELRPEIGPRLAAPLLRAFLL
jgi:hypothetical protein